MRELLILYNFHLRTPLPLEMNTNTHDHSPPDTHADTEIHTLTLKTILGFISHCHYLVFCYQLLPYHDLLLYHQLPPYHNLLLGRQLPPCHDLVLCYQVSPCHDLLLHHQLLPTPPPLRAPPPLPVASLTIPYLRLHVLFFYMVVLRLLSWCRCPGCLFHIYFQNTNTLLSSSVDKYSENACMNTNCKAL